MNAGSLSLDGRRIDETPKGIEFIGIPEWCRRVGCSRESGYRAARRDEIPGLFRIGRLKRVNWSVFVAATGPAKGTNASQADEWRGTSQ